MIAMSVDTFLGYLGRIPALRAERLLDAAATAHPTKEWIEALRATARERDDDGDVATPAGARSGFRLNGRPVTLVELKGSLAGALGGGFSVN